MWVRLVNPVFEAKSRLLPYCLILQGWMNTRRRCGVKAAERFSCGSGKTSQYLCDTLDLVLNTGRIGNLGEIEGLD